MSAGAPLLGFALAAPAVARVEAPPTNVDSHRPRRPSTMRPGGAGGVRPSTMRPDGAGGVRTKGTSVAAVLRFVRQNWGDEGLARLAAATRTPEVAALATGTVLAGSWYPFSQFTELLDTAGAVFGAGIDDFARREGASCADYDLRGVYRVFVRFTSPNFVVERSGKVWSQYYDSGSLVVVETDDAHVVFELRDFRTPHRAHCGTVLGWSERACELSGATVVHAVHSSCRARGDRRCVFEIGWK